MPEATHKFKFEKKFNIKSTADLTPTLDAKINFTIPLDGSEVSLAKKIETNFKKEFEKLVKAQISHLETWLKEKQKNIDDAKALDKNIRKMGMPKDDAGCKKLASELDKLAKLSFSADSLQKDFQKLIDGWADNVMEQQGYVALAAAKKQAGSKLLKDKKARMTLGKVVKGILLVSAIAVGVAALVLSAGTAAPLVLGLGIATAALSGGAGIVGFAKNVIRDKDLEKKILKNVEGELKNIKAAMAPFEKSSIGKHVSELDVVIKQRSSEIQKLSMEMKKTRTQIDSEIKALRKIHTEKSISEMLGDKVIKKQIDNCFKLKDEAEAIAKDLEKAFSIMNSGKSLIAELKAFNVKIEEFGKFYKSNSIGSNLKTYFSSVDGYTDLAKSLGAFRPGAPLAG
ncbi:MAG: hypothetical protein AB3N21_11690 [Ruegeria sp.]|uniref:hypothetical protein n=1 Tax=Ruegeria sp. TaxID=1879320 RepID=UPI00349EF496